MFQQEIGNQIIIAALRSIYSSGARNSWKLNINSYPYCDYKKEGARVRIAYFLPWEHPIKGLPNFTRRFMRTRWSLLHAHRVREAVREMTVETADVLLFLLLYLSKSSDPFRIGAIISLEELSEKRGVKVRHGSSKNLHRDLQKHLSHLANLRVTMALSVKSENELHSIYYCEESLFELVVLQNDWKRPHQESFHVTCGENLRCFLNQGNLYSVHSYCKYLLRLNPYKNAFTKKLGVFWLIYGAQQKQATPREMLEFSGEKANLRNPGQTVDMFIDAHNQLQDIGILKGTPLIEPFDRRKGYFDLWLDSFISVQLSENSLQSLQTDNGLGKSLFNNNVDEFHPDNPSGLAITEKKLSKNPQMIRKMRGILGQSQPEVASILGVSRQTLSKYERGISYLPKDKAVKLLAFWRSKLNDNDV